MSIPRSTSNLSTYSNHGCFNESRTLPTLPRFLMLNPVQLTLTTRYPLSLSHSRFKAHSPASFLLPRAPKCNKRVVDCFRSSNLINGGSDSDKVLPRPLVLPFGRASAYLRRISLRVPRRRTPRLDEAHRR